LIYSLPSPAPSSGIATGSRSSCPKGAGARTVTIHTDCVIATAEERQQLLDSLTTMANARAPVTEPTSS